jgi:hypothetical protein
MAQVVVLIRSRYHFDRNGRFDQRANQMFFSELPIVSLFWGFRTASDDIGDLITEFPPDFIRGNLGVFHDIVKQPSSDNGLVAAHLLQYHGYANRVGDEGHLAGLPLLVSMGSGSEANSLVNQ